MRFASCKSRNTSVPGRTVAGPCQSAGGGRRRPGRRRHGGELPRGDVRRLLPLPLRPRRRALLPPRAALPVRPAERAECRKCGRVRRWRRGKRLSLRRRRARPQLRLGVVWRAVPGLAFTAARARPPPDPRSPRPRSLAAAAASLSSAADQGGGSLRSRPGQRRRRRLVGVGGRLRRRAPGPGAVCQRQLCGVHTLLGGRGGRRRRPLHTGAVPRQTERWGAHGVPQPARLVLQRGGGAGLRPGAVRLRPLAPALRRLRTRAPPRGRVPRGGRAPQHGGRAVRRPAAGPRLAPRAVQARGVAAPRTPRASLAPRAPRLSPPGPGRLLAVLLPRAARSGAPGAGHLQGPVLVLIAAPRTHSPNTPRNYSCDSSCS